MKSLIISLHDVAPATVDASKQWMKLLDELNVVVSMLVVPGPWRGGELLGDNSFRIWLNETATDKHEVLQHGYSHTIDHKDEPGFFGGIVGNFAARGCQEFWGISEIEARNRLHSGLTILAKVGHRPTGFVAPGWLTSRAAVGAVRRVGFSYLTTHFFVRDLVSNKRYFAPVICQRPNSSSTLAVTTMTKKLAKALRVANLPIRVAIHPDDLERHETRDAIISVIENAIKSGYRSETYANFISARRKSKYPVLESHTAESLG